MSQSRKLLKTIPGLVVSAFFLWLTFRKVSFHTLLRLRLVNHVWVLGVVCFLIIGYTLRVHRWYRMLQSSCKSSFRVCARVLMTSFAANNILPFRIGDLMRVFTYANDLNASSSTILSTVILERVLDIFTLVLFLVASIWRGTNLPFPHIRRIAVLMLAAATAGLLVLMLGANVLATPLRRLISRLPQSPRVKKAEEWLFLALDAIRNIGAFGTLLLLAESIVIWACEGMIFVSCAKLLGITANFVAPWQALVLSNLSYMLPSTPGAIGTFEYFAKIAMTTHHVPDTLAALYALLVHVLILSAITAVGGIFFLLHRYHTSTRTPLMQEIETLPEGLP